MSNDRDAAGVKGYKKALQKLAPEDWHKRESIFALKGHTKCFNEHLGPLRRYLDKQVGRPWDKVLSEICEFIRVDSAVQSHVRDHVEQFVETHVIELDGIACHGSGRSLGIPLESRRWSQFYVCPRTGLLCRSMQLLESSSPISATGKYY